VEHYRLWQVGEGAWAAVANPGSKARANAGIVDLGDSTLVFDTFMDPVPALALRDDAVRLTGRSPGIVVNSHWHGDHVRGNQQFPDAEIVATARTKELVETRGRERLEEHRREDPDGLAGVEHTPPTTTFDTRRELGRAELLTYGGGHTDSDAFLYLPEEELAFVADLVVIDTHPWVGDGDVARWLGILARLEELDLLALVPGHGPVGVGDDIALMRAYLEDLRKLPAGAEMPPEYADLANEGLFARNLEALHG
jgi:glyoxylase-like metal-dependent hydrolase (beta-lactamase superfamily II)